ncbi:MAG: hypothetical protein HY006_01730 [Candidatus Sungbacteria bacterium]|nr:hypothetical protein [Candidatus Sungbacteria bacterium]
MLAALIFVVHVEGESALPLLIPGKKYWASGITPIRPNDFIVFSRPHNPKLFFVKRVQSIDRNGYDVQSMVSWGIAGDELGRIPKACVLGKILFVTSGPGRWKFSYHTL